MNARPLLIALGVLIVIFLLYLAFSAMNSETEPPYQATTQSATTTTTATPSAPTTPTAPATNPTASPTSSRPVAITYGANGFSPATITVPAGTTVTWTNEGTGRMWVATARHPDHTVYDGTSTAEHCASNAPSNASVFDQCNAGSSYSFTFTKPGTWAYHNHANASHFGSVTVTAR